MKVIHALQPLRKSIFLAGPTPRPPLPGHPAVPSWRPEALAIIEKLGFDGDVYVPEAENWAQHGNYDGQVQWEWEALNQCTVAAFWIPRIILEEIEGSTRLNMPAFTTNVEFGLYASSGKAVLGYPKGAEKMGYLHALARRFGMPVMAEVSLEAFLRMTIERANGMFVS